MTHVPRWLRLQEQIDYLYFELGQIRRGMPRNGIDRMIDEATGAEVQRQKEVRAIARRMKRLKLEWGKETGEPVNTEMEDQILALLSAKKPAVPTA